MAGLSVATLASRILGFGKNVIFAAALGTGVLADGYNIANQLPNMVFTVVAGGVLGAIFVPQLVAAQADGSERWAALAGKIMLATGGLAAAISLVLTLGAPWIVAALRPEGWTEADIARTLLLAYICLPQVFFYTVYAAAGQILNSRAKFGPMVWAPLINNLVLIGTGIWLLTSFTGPSDREPTLTTEGLLVLGLGTTAGVILQSVVVLLALGRLADRPRVLRRSSVSVSIMPSLRLAKWTLLQLLAGQLVLLAVVKLSATAGSELASEVGLASGFTAYNYAYLVILLPHAVIASPVATVMLQRLSRLVSTDDRVGFQTALSGARNMLAQTIVPISAMLVLAGPVVGQLLFAYGQTSSSDAWYLGMLLSFFSLGLWAMSSRSLLLYACFSVEKTFVPFTIVVAGSVVNLLGAVASLLILPTYWALPGMAAAFALGNIVVEVGLKLYLTHLALLPKDRNWSLVWRLALIVTFGTGVAIATSWILIGSMPWAYASASRDILICAFAILCGATGSMAMSLALRADPLAALRVRKF